MSLNALDIHVPESTSMFPGVPECAQVFLELRNGISAKLLIEQYKVRSRQETRQMI